jgi:hypothetical protein
MCRAHSADWRRFSYRSTANFCFATTLTGSNQRSLTRRSGNIRICRHPPSLKQPLRNVASVAILGAPMSQLLRRCVLLFGKPEPEHLHLEFSRRRGRNLRRFSAAPTRVAWFARQLSLQDIPAEGTQTQKNTIEPIFSGPAGQVNNRLCLVFCVIV